MSGIERDSPPAARLGALAAVSPIGFTAAWAIASAAQTG
jgi:hypothetical protein